MEENIEKNMEENIEKNMENNIEKNTENNIEENKVDEGTTTSLDSSKQVKTLSSQNPKIKKIIKKLLKHIKYLDKEINIYKKSKEKANIFGENMELLITNCQETLTILIKERNYLEKKYLDNKILIDKLKRTN